MVNRLPVHRYSADIFSYSVPSGILSSGGKKNIAKAGARGGMTIVALSISSHKKTQLNQVCCFLTLYTCISISEGSASRLFSSFNTLRCFWSHLNSY